MTLKEKEIRAEAVFGFMNILIKAFDDDFINENSLTLSEIYRIAQGHVEDNYEIKYESIVKAWGRKTAEECGLNDKVESK
jgi:hypothetical protein